jgi:multiple sugar transport system permease protein
VEEEMKISKWKITDGQLAWVLLSPVVIYLITVMVAPLFWAVGVSFTNKAIGMAGRFIGMQNYLELIHDPVFLRSISNTLFYTGAAVIAKVILGIVMALVLNEAIKLRGLFRALLILPWTLPSLVSIFTWQWMFSDIGGVLNYILTGIHLVNEPVGWLSDPVMAMFSVILVNTWRGMPFVGISVLAGLQTIPATLYESAIIDGANVWQRFFYITLPSVKGVVLLATLVTLIWTLNDFEIIWLLTGGGPSNATQVISTYSYVYGFRNFYLGKAIAVSVLTMPFIIMLVNWVTKKTLSDK